jgi:DNA-binding transcriptional regulator YdaS (Cro superfamily)
MTPERFYNAGAALYGLRWQRAMAGRLGVSESLVRFWVAGARTMPCDLAERLDALFAERLAELEAARRAFQVTGDKS